MREAWPPAAGIVSAEGIRMNQTVLTLVVGLIAPLLAYGWVSLVAPLCD